MRTRFSLPRELHHWGFRFHWRGSWWMLGAVKLPKGFRLEDDVSGA